MAVVARGSDACVSGANDAQSSMMIAGESLLIVSGGFICMHAFVNMHFVELL